MNLQKLVATSILSLGLLAPSLSSAEQIDAEEVTPMPEGEQTMESKGGAMQEYEDAMARCDELTIEHPKELCEKEAKDSYQESQTDTSMSTTEGKGPTDVEEEL